MTGVIVLKDKNQLIPDQYLEKVLAGNKSISGFAYADKGIVTTGSVPRVDLKEIQELHAIGKEMVIVNYFGNTKDAQPFVILENKDKKAVLVAFVEGNFNAFAQTDSSHSDEYHVIHNLLIPKAKQLYRLVKEDIAQFMIEIADPVTQNELINATVPRGTITIMGGNGAIFSFERNPNKGQFPWGWTSHTYDYVEKAPPKDEKPAGTSLKDQLFGKAKPTAKPEPATIVPGKDTSTPTVIHANKQEEVAELGGPPKDIQSKGALKKWYRHNSQGGILPVNWAERPEVPLKKKIKQFKDIPVVASTVPVIPKKDVDTTHVSKEITVHPKLDGQGKPEPKVPVIPPQQVQDFIDKVLKVVDTNSAEIPDPTKMQELEAKWPTFAEKVGLAGLEDTFKWSRERTLNLCKFYPDLANLLLRNYMFAYIHSLSERPGDKEKEKPPVTATAPAHQQPAKKKFAF